MVRHWRVKWNEYARFGAAAVVLGAVMSLASNASAAVSVTADPLDRYGAAPNVFTVDPFTAVVAASERANRGITADRKLRQTFKNPTTFNVGTINVSFDVTGGSTYGTAADTGLKLAFYQVDDVLSSPWLPIGVPIKEVTIPPGVLPANNEILRISLTGGDVFTLPQRNSGTTGYGVEISTPNAQPSDGNPGVLWFTNQDATPGPLTDFFADGRYYVEGGGSTSNRDVRTFSLSQHRSCLRPRRRELHGRSHARRPGHHRGPFPSKWRSEDGDLTGNGFIDFDDFHQWKQNYPGAFPGSGGGEFSNLPEPTSGLLVALGLVAVGSLARVRRRVM